MRYNCNDGGSTRHVGRAMGPGPSLPQFPEAFINKVNETLIHIDKDQRARIITMLNTGLATAIDLRSPIQQAHRNVRGPWFFARHQLFDEVAAHLNRHADLLAERVGALGGAANGTIRLAAAGFGTPSPLCRWSTRPPRTS